MLLSFVMMASAIPMPKYSSVFSSRRSILKGSTAMAREPVGVSLISNSARVGIK
jgi:hypothetical protein